MDCMAGCQFLKVPLSIETGNVNHAFDMFTAVTGGTQLVFPQPLLTLKMRLHLQNDASRLSP